MKSNLKKMKDMVPNEIIPGNTSRKVQKAAQVLGMVSIALGLTELVAAKQLDKFLGTGQGENEGVFRALGVREVCHGIDLLSHENPTEGLWARVAGDMLDGALLGYAAAKTDRPESVMAAAAMVLPVVAADIYYAMESSR